jgi:hypothetical protein
MLITAYASEPPVLAPACDRLAPLNGKWDSRAPGYIVQFVDDVADAEWFTYELARKYAFTPHHVWSVAIKGFSVRDMDP